MSPLRRIVCVHSLTAHGVVGLKAFLAVLGECCLPIPSVVLSGPGDMPGCARFAIDGEGLLRATLGAVRASGGRVGLFVGYLASVAQAGAIRDIIDEFRDVIATVLVDPICGDHGRAYVAPELITAWPSLLEWADWGFPNATELELLTGACGDKAIDRLQRRFPRTNFVITGVESEGQMETHVHRHCGEHAIHRQLRIDARFNGTGDLFAAQFVREVFFRSVDPSVAAGTAATAVAAAIHAAHAAGDRDLHLRAI